MSIIDVIVMLLLIDVSLALVVALVFGERIMRNYHYHDKVWRDFTSLAATFFPLYFLIKYFNPPKRKNQN